MSLFNRKKGEVPQVQVDGDRATIYPSVDKPTPPLEDPLPPEPPRITKELQLPKTSWAA